MSELNEDCNCMDKPRGTSGRRPSPRRGVGVTSVAITTRFASHRSSSTRGMVERTIHATSTVRRIGQHPQHPKHQLFDRLGLCPLESPTTERCSTVHSFLVEVNFTMPLLPHLRRPWLPQHIAMPSYPSMYARRASCEVMRIDQLSRTAESPFIEMHIPLKLGIRDPLYIGISIEYTSCLKTNSTQHFPSAAITPDPNVDAQVCHPFSGITPIQSQGLLAI